MASTLRAILMILVLCCSREYSVRGKDSGRDIGFTGMEQVYARWVLSRRRGWLNPRIRRRCDSGWSPSAAAAAGHRADAAGASADDVAAGGCRAARACGALSPYAKRCASPYHGG